MENWKLKLNQKMIQLNISLKKLIQISSNAFVFLLNFTRYSPITRLKTFEIIIIMV